MATKYRKRGLHVIMANPFKSNDKASEITVTKMVERGLDKRPRNMTFHRVTTHPLVTKHGATMTPGWNVGNMETLITRQNACYVLFDRKGQMVFQGRLSFAELEQLLKRAL